MSVVVSTFPSLNAFSARSWTLAAIIALHAGFFWLLSSGGMSIILPTPPQGTEMIQLDPLPPPPPSPRRIEIDDLTTTQHVTLPPQPRVLDSDDEEQVIRTEVTEGPPLVSTTPATPAPVITLPSIDPRLGLSEPVYPASERRGGYQGTVVLAIEVLENGRVGQARIEQSSGRERLDEAALRQTSRWRFKPGMRDGVPVVMWKRIPVHFRLTESGERF